VKVLFLEGLAQELRELERLNKNNETTKKNNYEVLSTTISECQSIGYQIEKDVDELEENIIRMRMIKF
jgi:archaellum component FlaC